MPDTKVTVALSLGSSRSLLRRMAAIGSSTELLLFDKGEVFFSAAGEARLSPRPINVTGRLQGGGSDLVAMNQQQMADPRQFFMGSCAGLR